MGPKTAIANQQMLDREAMQNKQLPFEECQKLTAQGADLAVSSLRKVSERYFAEHPELDQSGATVDYDRVKEDLSRLYLRMLSRRGLVGP